MIGGKITTHNIYVHFHNVSWYNEVMGRLFDLKLVPMSQSFENWNSDLFITRFVQQMNNFILITSDHISYLY